MINRSRRERGAQVREIASPKKRRGRLLRTLAPVLLFFAAGLSGQATASNSNGDDPDDILFYNTARNQNAVPVLFGDGASGWNARFRSAPAWATAQNSVPIQGDFDRNGTTDVAFHNPGGNWVGIPILFSPGVNGGMIRTAKQVSAPDPMDLPYTTTFERAPAWANSSGSIPVTGDFNGDDRTDIAFYNPGSNWSEVKVLQAVGDGSWQAYSRSVPSWANAPGVVAISGDYDGDGRDDIAFYNPGSNWASLPVLFGHGDGYWQDTNRATSRWISLPGIVARAGDFNGDKVTDLAFYAPGSSWTHVPRLISNRDGSWKSENAPAPDWAHAPGSVAFAGDYDGDGTDDLAFHGKGEDWKFVPVLLSDRRGFWMSHEGPVSAPVNNKKVSAVAGDFDGDGLADLAFHRRDGMWRTVPMLLSNKRGGWIQHDHPAPVWANSASFKAIGSEYRLVLNGESTGSNSSASASEQESSTVAEVQCCDPSLPAPTIVQSVGADNALGFRWEMDWPDVQGFVAFLTNTTNPQQTYTCFNSVERQAASQTNEYTGDRIPTEMGPAGQYMAGPHNRHMLIAECNGPLLVGTDYRVVVHAVGEQMAGPASSPVDVSLTVPHVLIWHHRNSHPVPVVVDRIELLYDGNETRMVDSSMEDPSILYPAEAPRDPQVIEAGSGFDRRFGYILNASKYSSLVRANGRGPENGLANPSRLEEFKAIHFWYWGAGQTDEVYSVRAGSYPDRKAYAGPVDDNFVGPWPRFDGVRAGLYDNSGSNALHLSRPLAGGGMHLVSGRLTSDASHVPSNHRAGKSKSEKNVDVMRIEWNFNAAIIDD